MPVITEMAVRVRVFSVFSTGSLAAVFWMSRNALRDIKRLRGRLRANRSEKITHTQNRGEESDRCRREIGVAE